MKRSRRQKQHPLYHAVYFGTAEDVATILAAHPDAVNTPMPFGVRLPLHCALVFNSSDVVRVLLDYGANAHTRLNGGTPLHFASSSSKPDADKVWLLLAAGVHIHSASELPWRGNPLFTAVRHYPRQDHLESGYDGWTPEKAARQLEVVKALLDAGADPNSRSVDGETALHEAVTNRRHAAADLLLEVGADVDARDATGQTPLHRAAAVRNKRMLYRLLSRGADASLVDNSGRTPRQVAEEVGSAMCVRIIDTTPRPPVSQLLAISKGN